MTAPLADGTGIFKQAELRSGLRLHAADVTETRNFRHHTELQPGLTVTLFLSGQTRIALGNREHDLLADADTPQGIVLACAEQDIFSCERLCDCRVRRVSISLPRAWIDQDRVDGPCVDDPCTEAIRRFSRHHGDSLLWRPSAHLAALAERMLLTACGGSFLERLRLESEAAEMVASGLRLFDGQDSGVLSGRDRMRLRRLHDYIDTLEGDSVTLEDIARQAGMSVSALQRLFRAAEGVSVFEYIRLRRLERARAALERQEMSVTEAAYLAGYGSPANFATAFKRQFGLTPRETLKRR